MGLSPGPPAAAPIQAAAMSMPREVKSTNSSTAMTAANGANTELDEAAFTK